MAPIAAVCTKPPRPLRPPIWDRISTRCNMSLWKRARCQAKPDCWLMKPRPCRCLATASWFMSAVPMPLWSVRSNFIWQNWPKHLPRHIAQWSLSRPIICARHRLCERLLRPICKPWPCHVMRWKRAILAASFARVWSAKITALRRWLWIY